MSLEPLRRGLIAGTALHPSRTEDAGSVAADRFLLPVSMEDVPRHDLVRAERTNLTWTVAGSAQLTNDGRIIARLRDEDVAVLEPNDLFLRPD